MRKFLTNTLSEYAKLCMRHNKLFRTVEFYLNVEARFFVRHIKARFVTLGSVLRNIRQRQQAFWSHRDFNQMFVEYAVRN